MGARRGLSEHYALTCDEYMEAPISLYDRIEHALQNLKSFPKKALIKLGDEAFENKQYESATEVYQAVNYEEGIKKVERVKEKRGD